MVLPPEIARATLDPSAQVTLELLGNEPVGGYGPVFYAHGIVPVDPEGALLTSARLAILQPRTYRSCVLTGE